MKWIGYKSLSDITSVTAGTNLTGGGTSGDITLSLSDIITTDQLSFESANSTDPLIIIKNTTDDAYGGRLRFLNSRGADGQDGDEAGKIEFYSYDDGTPSGEEYATIKATIHDATSTEESGKLQLQVASHDGGTEDGLVLTGGSEDAEVDVTIGNGANSATTVAGVLRVTTSLYFDTVSLSTIQTSAESFVDNDTSLMTSAAIADKLEAYGYSTATGDITGVTITADDENIASDTAGSADFSLVGANGLTTSVSSQTITVTAASASASAKGVVELATTGETTTGTDTTRAVTPDGLKDGYQGSSNVVTLGTITPGVWR